MNRKIFVYLLPLFILYCGVFAFLAKNSLDYGDEPRYAMYAGNLTNGFYAPADTRMLWNGPGYPLLLTPFAYFKIPWIYAKMLNPLFIFLAVCFFYSVIRNFASEKASIFFAYLFGLYPPFFGEFRYLLTEPFVLMLTTLFSLLVWKWFGNRKPGWFLGAAAVFAVIALTKVFFGYVALGVMNISLAAFAWSRTMRLTLPIYALALALCTPYLFYTYNLTGKVFRWANSGGSVLYWMYTPDANDFGSWFSDTDVASRPELAHHRAFFEELKGLDYEQRDQLMKKKAIENIRSNPRKMILNYVSNVSRLFLNFPFSYKYQRPQTLLYLVPNSLILGAIIFSLYPLIRLRRLLPEGVVHACSIAIVFIGGQSLVYAEARYLCPILPFVFLVIAYTATNLVKVQKLEQ